MVIIALVLSSASLVMSAFAANNIWHGNSASHGSAAAVTPKFAGSAEPSTGEEEQLINHQNDITEPESESGDETPGVTTESTDPKDAPQADASDSVTTQTPPAVPQKEGKEAKTGAKSEKKKAQKVIYLTFDDGPGKYTDQIVSILNKHGIHATFFMIGNQVSGNEKAIKTAAENGNYVGLHSMTHDKKKLYKSSGSARFIKEFKQEQEMISKITGTKPWLIRAPYGSKPEINDKFLDDIAAAKFKMWDWTVDSKDWYYPGKPERIIQEIKRQVHRDTEVILMHEKSQTVQALPEIIEYLKKKGYSFAVYKPDQHFSVNFAKDERL
ncbi:polysaccharide deacetylase family protein [Fontibacillus sp. BL9]|uniref:polysaccharide deacetylase family protein n=1 Tax=Fontibacillus sp. BL9 TaxID=3389971 RepID=UPI00397AD48B